MQSSLMIATQSGVLSYRLQDPVGSWELRASALPGEWVWVVVSNPANPHEWYAGTREHGVLTSADGGGQWSSLGDGPPFSYVRGLTISPLDPDTIYAGTEPATVFRYRRGGPGWEETPVRKLSQYNEWTFPQPPHTPHVKSMAADPQRAETIYAAVEEGWVIRSDDGGNSWVECTEGLHFDAHIIRVHPRDPNTLLCCTGRSLFCSSDCGAHWHKVPASLPREYIGAFLIHPADPDRWLLAATNGPPPSWRHREIGADSGLYETRDRGAHWMPLTAGLPDVITAPIYALVAAPENPEVFFLGMRDGTVWVSTDAGQEWRCVLKGLPPIQDMAVLVE